MTPWCIPKVNNKSNDRKQTVESITAIHRRVAVVIVPVVVVVVVVDCSKNHVPLLD